MFSGDAVGSDVCGLWLESYYNLGFRVWGLVLWGAWGSSSAGGAQRESLLGNEGKMSEGCKQLEVGEL